MKKICLTLLLLIPALFASAQGPIKMWNDQLDDFIEVFNQIDPALDQLYTDNGLSTYTFTYFEPESGNVVKETTIFDPNTFGTVDDNFLAQAKSIALNHLANAAKTNTRISSILNEFNKRNTNIVLLYSTEKNGNRVTKQITITPNEIKSAR